MYGNRNSIRSRTVPTVIIMSVLMMVAAALVIGSDASDADTTSLDVTYIESEPTIGGPAIEITNDGSLKGKYSMAITDSEGSVVDTFDVTNDLTGTPGARIGVESGLDDGVYTVSLRSLSDSAEIHQGKFIVGDVEVTADTQVTVKLGTTGTINLTLPQWLDASDVTITPTYDTGVMTITAGTGASFTVTPVSMVDGSSVTFSISFNGTEVATAETTVTITYADVESVSITGPNEVVVGAEFNLVATVNPSNANPSVTWSVSGDAVTSNGNGSFTAADAGSVTITATAVGDSTKSNTYTVTVKEKSLESVQITGGQGVMEVGSSLTLGYTLNPSDIEGCNASWSISGEAVTGSSGSGGYTITANSVGEATVTLTVTDANGDSKTATLQVEVVTVTHTITITSSGQGGTVTPSGTQNVPDQGSLEITVSASSGYQIQSVKVDGSDVQLTDRKYTFTGVTGDHTFAVVFVYVGPVDPDPPVDPDDPTPDDPVNPPYDPDDEYVPLPPHVGGESEDDTTTIVACAAAAVVAALIAVFLIMEYRKR